MLYKMYESSPYAYRRAYEMSGGIWWGDPSDYYNPDNYLESFCAPYAHSSYCGGPMGLWITKETTGNSLTKIYGFFKYNPIKYPLSWTVGCWDGTTGEFLWKDPYTWDPYKLGFLSRSNWYCDDTYRVWSRDLWGGGYVRHTVLATAKTPHPAGQPGMPDLMTADYVIKDYSLRNEDDSDSAYTTIVNVPFDTMCLSWPGDWYLCNYSGYGVINGEQPPTPNWVAVHRITPPRIRLGYIPLRNRPWYGLCVNTETAYVFSATGDIEVLDIPRLRNLGLLKADDEDLGIAWNYFDTKVAVVFDRIARKIVTCKLVGDDPETGACRTNLKGYKLREVAERICKPIPLEVPRIGKTVKVYSRVYGKSGSGTPGLAVNFTLDAPDGSLNPGKIASDETGEVYSYWTCGQSGPDIATITVSTQEEQVLPGLTVPVYEYPLLTPPTSITQLSQEEYFFPGWWLLSRSDTRVKTKTASESFEQFLSAYYPVDEEDVVDYGNPFFGAMLEYTWYDLEADPGVYNWTKIDNDLSYLASKNMKAIIAVRSGPYVGSTLGGEAWIPDYITQDESELFPISGNVYDPLNPLNRKSGVFATVNNYSSDINLNTVYPSIFDSAVRTSLMALLQSMVERYLDNDTVVGFAPLDMPCVSSNGIKYAIYGSTSLYTSTHYWAARRTILQSLVSNKPIFEWAVPNIYVNLVAGDWCQIEDFSSGSHASWCYQNRIGLLSGMWFSYRSTSCNFSKVAGERLADANKSVPTGVCLPEWSWSDPRNLDCFDNQCSFKELSIGGFEMWGEGCEKYYVERYKPWMIFVEPDSSSWAGEEGIYEVTANYRIDKNKRYYG